jgi:uncharacterized UBP type Zn finger protein
MTARVPLLLAAALFRREPRACEHLDLVREVAPSSPDGCTECLVNGDDWVHLRICLVCGQVGCCDNSKNRHATKHFRTTGHPVIQSFEPGERWRYCYEDGIYLPKGEAFRSEG